mgnify:CR=1 FL=1
MFIQHHGALQQKQPIAGVAKTLTISPTYVYLTTIGQPCSGFANTITVTASAGNTWNAYVSDGTSWVRIDGETNGTASDTGSGSFVITATKLLSGSRLGEVTVTDGTNTRYVTVSQGPCPA